MTRALATALVALAALAGCGEAGPAEAPDDPGQPSAAKFAFEGCPVDDPALRHAKPVIEADLLGDGTRTSIRLVPRDAAGPCKNALVAEVAGRLSGVPLGDTVLDPGTADVVALRGTQRQLVVVRGEAHPRGGFPLHVYGAGADGLGEILEDGQPILDFVATDGGAAPATAMCAAGGRIATVTTVTHKPPGIVLAWDVTTTTYLLDGTRVRATSSRTEDGIADPILQKERPALFDPESYFSDCRE